jgi:hypothetical protein
MLTLKAPPALDPSTAEFDHDDGAIPPSVGPQYTITEALLFEGPLQLRYPFRIALFADTPEAPDPLSTDNATAAEPT